MDEIVDIDSMVYVFTCGLKHRVTLPKGCCNNGREAYQLLRGPAKISGSSRQ
jgi:hypothetical protein